MPDKPLLTTDQWLDLLGIVLIGLAGLTILGALSSERSELIQGWLGMMQQAFGWGVFLAPVLMIVTGVFLLLRRFGDRFPRLAPTRLLGVALLFVAALGTLHLIGMVSTPDADALAAERPGAAGCSAAPS